MRETTPVNQRCLSATGRSSKRHVNPQSARVRRSTFAALVAVVLAASAAARADAWLTLGLDSTDAGQVAFWVRGFRRLHERGRRRAHARSRRAGAHGPGGVGA